MAREDRRSGSSDDDEEIRDSRQETRRHQDRDDEVEELIDRKKSSRTPDRKKRTRSPERGRRTRSPDRKQRIRSPDRKERTRSPGRKERTRSPERKERTRSPDRKERSRKKSKKRKYESSDSDSPISSPSRSSPSAYSSSPSGESSDGERQKREKRKRRELKKENSRRGGKEETSSKSKKSKKRKHRSDKDREEEKRRKVKEAKKFLKKHRKQEELNALEVKASGRKVDQISANDYFLKSSEFAMWLKEDRGVYFTDLSSKETHELFEPFVDKWNAGRLHPKYYDGIQQAPRTNHNWAIKNAPAGSAIDDEDDRALAKKRDKYERKVFQKEHEAVLDEMLPKATGRERQMELKAIRREQARTREESPPDAMRERDIMGGGDDFQQRLARERARREKRQSEKMAVYSEKRSVVEDRETATMEQFKTLVDVAGGKITIAKRR